MDEPTERGGFDEAQLRFAADALASVFAMYDHACAFTGQRLALEAEVDARGHLLNLTDNPLATDPTVLIPGTLDVIYAFEQGHLALGPRYNFLVDLERIDPELLERLNPIGRLRLPSDPAFIPAQAKLTPHLLAFATGRRGRQ